MDLDLEADLGVDTVKQAETFAAVREAYGIARQENLKLRDFPTLTHVVKFVYDFRPDLKPRRPAAAAGVPRARGGPVPIAGRPTLGGLPTARRSRGSRAPARTPSCRRCSRSWPRRPATRRTCWRWTSTSRPTSASTR